MATTGIWKIEKRLDHVLNYVINPEKTTKDSSTSYQEFHKLDEYENMSYETEQSCYVSSLNCSTHRTYQDMMFTKDQYGKKNGILGYHAFQSFKEGEITPDKAHLIGIKLAEEMWGDGYEVIISTHTNTHCIHNHFVINSVSFKDGKKYHDCRENLALLRHTSDSLCQEYGLSVLKEKQCKRGKINYDNYYKGYVTRTNYHTITKKDIDKAIAMAYSFKDFENIMIKMGYELTYRYDKISIRREPYKKNIRIERAFGSDYSIKEIGNRIENTTAPRVPFIEAYNPKNRIKVYEKAKSQKAHGLYGLYKYYCYILKVYPRHYPNKVLSPALRLEVQKMNDISQQTRLLVSNKIETYEQLLFYKDNLNNDIRQLLGKKHNLWIRLKRSKSEEIKLDIRNEIESIDKLLIPKRKEVVLCENIEKRINIVKENIKEFEEEKGKEKRKDEF